MNDRIQATTADQVETESRTNVLAAAVAAALFGTFLFLGMGFAHSDAIHNATHDVRHALALPCH